jgi:hypothetical protein
VTPKYSEEFTKFDKAMDKILSVSKEELNRRLKAAKKAKKGKRYPIVSYQCRTLCDIRRRPQQVVVGQHSVVQ